MRILVVDDDPGVARMIDRAYRSRDWEVIEADDAIQAVFHAKHVRPDVVILDIVLPGTSGLSVLERIRAHKRTADLPVIVISGDAEAAEEAMALGANSFHPKPLDLDRLAEEIEAAVR